MALVRNSKIQFLFVVPPFRIQKIQNSIPARRSSSQDSKIEPNNKNQSVELLNPLNPLNLLNLMNLLNLLNFESKNHLFL